MSSDRGCSATSTATTSTGGTVLCNVHTDILETHILNKLDGPSLASACCVSSELRTLCGDENLWMKVCHSTWPSINDPRVREAISDFPYGYRAFFSNCFSSLGSNGRQIWHDSDHTPETTELISAIDIHYKNTTVCSMVEVTEGQPTWVELTPGNRDTKGAVPAVFLVGRDELLFHAMEQVNLSWIVIDPARKLAANLSSLEPILVKPHWLKYHVDLRYSTILTTGDSSEMVEFRITVTCQCKVGGEILLKEVALEVEDREGNYLNAKDSIVILQEAEKSRRRDNEGRLVNKRVRYEKYMKLKNKRRKNAQGKKIGPILMFKIVCIFVISVVFSFCTF